MPKGEASWCSHKGKNWASFLLEKAPLVSGNHQACPLPLLLPVLLLQDQKIKALEELVETLQEQNGKMLSR